MTTKNIFTQRVLSVVSNIPKGSVLTYKEVARRAGSPRAYRAVGNVLSKNYSSKVPCHRVVRADGTLGGYNRGAEEKRLILKREGVLVTPFSF
jgi:methylated-DNA-[protein]-cysteine S-methyltransferase